MNLDVENTLSISKVNQNFSSAARMTEKKGVITIMKNNQPKFILMTYNKFKEYEAEKSK